MSWAIVIIILLGIVGLIAWTVVRRRSARPSFPRPSDGPTGNPLPGGESVAGRVLAAGGESHVRSREMPRIVSAERQKNVAVGRTVRCVSRAPVFALIESVVSLSDSEEIAAAIARAVEGAAPTFPAICEALRDTSSQLLARSVALGRKEHGGASVVALVVEPSQVSIAHTGALRVYVVREGEATLLTQDHGPVRDYAVARGLSEEDIAALLEDPGVPHRRIVTRLVGNKPEVSIDRIEWPHRTGDTFILLSSTMALAARREVLGRLVGRSSELEAMADAVLEALGSQQELWSDPTAILVQLR